MPISTPTAFKWLLQQTARQRVWLGLAVASGFAGGLLLIGQAWLLAGVIHAAFIEATPRQDLMSLLVGMVALIVTRAALVFFRLQAGFHAGAGVRRQLRHMLLKHLEALGPAYLHGQQTGTVASSVLDQVEAIHNFYAYYLPQLALAVCVPSAFLVAVFPLSWAAGGLLLLTAPLIPLFMILVGMGAASVSQRQFQALGRLSAHFLDVLQGITTLKLFDRCQSEAERIGAVSEDYRQRTMKVLRIAFLSSAVLEFFSSLAIALVAVYLGLRYLGYLHFGSYGEMLSLQGGLFILLLAPEFYLPLRDLGTHYHARAEALGAAEEILKVLSRQPLIDNPYRTKRPVPERVGIEARKLQLSFDEGRRQALKGVSFTLAPGEKVAVVGPSGTGKTSLLNLILGFYLPISGSLLINGHPMGHYGLAAWRQRIAWVGQRPYLYHGSIRENIALGNPRATDGQIEAAAAQAHVLEFSRRLPAGLDTAIGEQGQRLSRGQAQRIVLARTLLKNAALWLLDEPTAGLDRDTEQRIISTLHTHLTHQSLLMMTHRPATIAHMDRILVMEQGRIVTQGTYAQLVKQGYLPANPAGDLGRPER
jgi:ATP-binding cassette subfamily C protein CydD